MARILVTGAGGFLGAHLVETLREGGAEVIAMERRGAFAADITDSAALDDLIGRSRPDAVVHLAGVTVGPPEEIERVNVGGARNLFASLARHAASCRIVIAGSAAEYGPPPIDASEIDETAPCRPAGAYGRSKLAVTTLAQELARSGSLHSLAIIRPFNIVGPGVPERLLVGALLRRIHAAMQPGAEPSVVVGNVAAERDFIAVEDVVASIVALLPRRESGDVYNICSGRPVRIRDVLERLLALAPVQIAWRQDPALLRGDEVPRSVGSHRKASAAFGFQPRIPLEDSLRAAWNAYEMTQRDRRR